MRSGQETVAIVGIGRVGLPLALFLADRGCVVHGVDRDAEYVQTLLETRRMPFGEEGAQPVLEAVLGKRFLPGSDLSVIARCEVVVVTIGTPIDEHMNPVLGPVEQIFRDMAPHLRAGHTILLRSTVSPGTTGYLARVLEQSGAPLPGRGIHLAFCPERIAQGHSLEELAEIPQIVGGVDTASTTAAAAFFARFGMAILETDAMSAELAKLFCNMYRYIDFAMANEFMMLATEHGRNIYEIVRLINDGYKRGGVKQPGLTGGPCLYKDGFFLIERTPYPELISNAWKINESVPAWLVARLEEERAVEGRSVGLFGLAFKRNSDDTRNSLSFKFLKILRRKGASVVAHDPFVQPDTLEEALESEILVFATNHDAYADWGLEGLRQRARSGALVCDPWNLFGTERIVFTLGDQAGPARDSDG